MTRLRRLFVPLLACVVASACVAPRSMMQSGRVTPRGEFRGGAGLDANIGTASAGAIFDGLVTAVDKVAAQTDKNFNEDLNLVAKAALAYSLDPAFGSSPNAFLRYGVYDRVDAGWRYSYGAHVLDARVQFLGEPGTRARDAEKDGTDAGFSGSVGLQYSGQSYELPSFGGIDKVGAILGFTMERTDLLVPIAISKPFGPGEKYGALSFGVIGGYTWLEYGLNPFGIVKSVEGVEKAVAAVSKKQGFATFGGFFNVKGGFRFGYVGLGLAIYRQNYGSFEVLDTVKFDLAGFTIVPSVSIEGRY